MNFRNFAKSFVKKMLTLSWFLIHSSSKIFFSYKDPILNDLKSFLVHKFTCASCSSSYIGETCCHFKTRIEEHIKKDNKSHIFKHLHSTATCFDSYNLLCFKIIDRANSKFDLKVKEALHINWRKPDLNDHSMIEMRCLKNIVIFVQTIISFVLSRRHFLYV